MPDALLRERVAWLEMELQAAEMAGFRRLTPPPFPLTESEIQFAEIQNTQSAATATTQAVPIGEQVIPYQQISEQPQVPTARIQTGQPGATEVIPFQQISEQPQMQTARIQTGQPGAAEAGNQTGGIPSGILRKPAGWNGSTPFKGFASALTIYFRATGISRE